MGKKRTHDKPERDKDESAMWKQFEKEVKKALAEKRLGL